MRERQRRAAARHGEEADQIARELRTLHAHSGHSLSRLWDDWITSMALAISNALDQRPEVWQRREDEYMQIVARHGKPTMEVFKAMMHGPLTEALTGEPTDVLGSIYMALELGNDHAGQFFTPSSLCDVIVELQLDPGYMHEQVERRGWLAVQEPAIGGGAMVIPIVGKMLAAGLNPSEHLHVTGIDVDSSVLRMAYVQLSLLGVPAVLWVGDTLRMEMRDAWYTPVHILLGWGTRLRNRPLLDMLRRLDVALSEGGDGEPTEVPESLPIVVPAAAAFDGDGPRPQVRQPEQRELFGLEVTI